jgi:hypothetical protein
MIVISCLNNSQSVENINHDIGKGGPQNFEADGCSDIYLKKRLIFSNEIILIEEEHHCEGKVHYN